MAYIFQTERLGFRLFGEEDKEPFSMINADDDVMRYFPRKLDLEGSNGFVQKILMHCDQYGYGLYAVDELSSGQFMGFIGFYTANLDVDFAPCVEIGWRLNKKFWHKGYATEGAKACLEHAKTQRWFDDVYSFTSIINRPSSKVMEKIGMSFLKTFQHPNIEDGNPLKEHVLYHIGLK